MKDVIIVGGGPGGYVMAIRASQLGLSVLLIDKRENLGGTCLNVGCIPSKTLLHETEHHSTVDFNELMTFKEGVVNGLASGVRSLMMKNKVEVVQGAAQMTGPNRVNVDGKEYEGQSIVLATGSESIPLPFLPFDEEKIVSSTGALSLKHVPKNMIVVGAGVIGVELASVYCRLGSNVRVIEILDRICPPMDLQVAKTLQRLLEKQGIVFELGKSFSKEDITQDIDTVLVSIGRRPYSEGLGLDVVGIEKDGKGFIPVNEHFQTSVPSIYAIGDLIEGPMLAHRASEEGVVLAEFLANHKSKIDYMTIPNVIYTSPEVATVGFSEEDAKQYGIDTMVGLFSLKANSRARTGKNIDGLVKVIGDKKSGKLIGMHLVMPHAGEMIALGSLAIKKRATIEEIANTPFPHPTLSESIKEASLHAMGRSIHS